MRKLLLINLLFISFVTLGQTKILDFEPDKTFGLANNNGTNTQFKPEIAANPVKDGINTSDTSVKITKEVGAPNWAFPFLNKIGSDPGGWNFTAGKVMQIKFMSVNKTDFTLTLRPWVNGAAVSDEIDLSFSGLELNKWYIAEFDYTAVADGWANRIDVWFNRNGGSDDGDVFYIDDITQSVAKTLNTEKFEFNNVKLYPNPTTGIIHFTGLENANSITIHNVIGQQVKKIKLENSLVDISDLNKGVYILKSDNGLQRKIVKN